MYCKASLQTLYQAGKLNATYKIRASIAPKDLSDAYTYLFNDEGDPAKQGSDLRIKGILILMTILFLLQPVSFLLQSRLWSAL